MTSSYPVPPAPPKFNHTPESIQSTWKRLIETSKAREDGLVENIKLEDATFDNVLKILSEDQNDMKLEDYITFYQHVSDNKALRDASSEAEQKLSDYSIESSMRQDVYKLVAAVHGSNEKKPLNLSPESFRFLDKTYKDYVRSGLGLNDTDQTKFKELQKELSNLGIEFSKNLGEENGGLWFTCEELDGLPKDVLNGLTKGTGENEGKVKLTYKYPDYIPAMQNVINPEVRKKIFLGNENKCNQNVQIFEKAIKLRDEAARLLGFKSHAEFKLDTKMAKNPATVMSFLEDLKTQLTPGGKKELATLKELKAQELQKLNLPNNGKYYLWDHSYYNQLLLKDKYAINQEEISEYFPLGNTLNCMFKIFETIFGLEFVEVTGDEKDVWHEETKQFRVYNEKPSDGSEQTFVGWFYLDLHPREGKYGHAANFGLQPGFTKKDGTRRYPATALVCNFSKPTPTKPSLLKHNEVVTLFHELGHGIHDLVAITHYSRFHGTNTVNDFVEAPSQMLENWCWSLPELTGLSKHWETGAKIPEEMAINLIKSKHVNDALANLRQLHFGFFDMKMHNLSKPEDADKIEASTVYNRMRTEITGLDPPEGYEETFAHGEATFGHLMGGYDAGYYGYLWSQVFSTDMFYAAFKANPMDPAKGRQYRHMVLEKGGSRDEMESLKEFLGREPNSKAFLEELGLGK